MSLCKKSICFNSVKKSITFGLGHVEDQRTNFAVVCSQTFGEPFKKQTALEVPLVMPGAAAALPSFSQSIHPSFNQSCRTAICISYTNE